MSLIIPPNKKVQARARPGWLDVSKLPKTASAKIVPMAVPKERTGAPRYADAYVETPGGIPVPSVPDYVPETLLDRAYVHRMEHELSKVCNAAQMDLREMRYLTSKKGSVAPGSPPVIGLATFVMDFVDYNNVRHTATATCAINDVGTVLTPKSIVVDGGREVPLTVEGMRSISEGIFFPTPIPGPIAPRQEVWDPELARDLIHLGSKKAAIEVVEPGMNYEDWLEANRAALQEEYDQTLEAHPYDLKETFDQWCQGVWSTLEKPTKTAALTDSDIAALRRQFPETTPEEQQQMSGLNTSQMPTVKSFEDLGALDGGVVVSFAPQLMQISKKPEEEFAYDTAKQWGYEIKGSPIYKQETDGVLYLAFLDDDKLARLMEKLIERVSPTMDPASAQESFNEFIRSMNYTPTAINNAVVSALLERYNQATAKKLSLDVTSAVRRTADWDSASYIYRELMQDQPDRQYQYELIQQALALGKPVFREMIHRLLEGLGKRGPQVAVRFLEVVKRAVPPDVYNEVLGQALPSERTLTKSLIPTGRSDGPQKTAEKRDERTLLPTTSHDEVTSKTYKERSVAEQSKSDPDYSDGTNAAESAGLPGYFRYPDHKFEERPVKTAQFKDSLLDANLEQKGVDQLQMMLLNLAEGAKTPLTFPISELWGMSREELIEAIKNEMSKNFSVTAGKATIQTVWLEDAKDAGHVVKTKETEIAPPEEGLSKEVPFEAPPMEEGAGMEEALPGGEELPAEMGPEMGEMPFPGGEGEFSQELPSGLPSGMPAAGAAAKPALSRKTAEEQPRTTLRPPYKRRPEDVPEMEATTAPEATPQMKTQFDEIQRATTMIEAIDADLAKVQAEMKKELSEKEKASGKAEEMAAKQRAIEELARLLEVAESRTAQFGDVLVSLIDTEKDVPAQVTPTWERNKLLERFGKEAEEYLARAKQGMQSMATKLHVRELKAFPKREASADDVELHELYEISGYIALYVDTLDNLIEGSA